MRAAAALAALFALTTANAAGEGFRKNAVQGKPAAAGWRRTAKILKKQLASAGDTAGTHMGQLPCCGGVYEHGGPQACDFAAPWTNRSQGTTAPQPPIENRHEGRATLNHPPRRVRIKPEDLKPRRGQIAPLGDPPACGVCQGCCPWPAGAESWSESREDAALYHRYFCLTGSGTFVEVGGTDGVSGSSTLFFEKYLGWRGVIVETNADNMELLQKNRPEARVFSRTSCSLPGARPADCRPLGKLLREAGVERVDLMVLDADGFEPGVLEGMDWTIPVAVWVVEQGNQERNRAVEELMVSKGYRPAPWNIRNWCRMDDCCCKPSAVYEHPQLVAEPAPVSLFRPNARLATQAGH
eukprot:TRINITY_DN65049_c0_g1_i1.p1 TRINITY_DN65049_c0_g1~~TRINITY_DN65049_c0_g1_i1.p1  ORF type:complete len:389 (+),score=82.19 TRINITY_DN65049_c0_g1_i1:106-1167(+)